MVSCRQSVESIKDSTPWFAFSLGKTWFLSDNSLRVSRILHPGCEMCRNLPLQLKIPPFPRITEILGFVGLCCTFKDFDGHPWAPGSSLVLKCTSPTQDPAVPAYYGDPWFCWPVQRFQGLRRTPLGPRVLTCVVIYHSNSTSRPSCVLRKSLVLLACATLSRT